MQTEQSDIGFAIKCGRPSICNVAIKTAKESKFNVFRHGAVIAKGNSVFVSGVNTPKPRTPNSSFSTHAEMWVLKRLQSNLVRKGKFEKYDIYVARVTPTNHVAMSRPCDKCMQALKESGIVGTVHYTTNFGWESVTI